MQAIFSKHVLARLIFMIGPVLLLTGCGPEIIELQSKAQDIETGVAERVPLKGQVFVVTSSGQSVTLGSVRVQLFAAESIASHLEEREREIEALRKEKKAQIRKLEEKAEFQLARKEEAERGHAERLNEMRAEIAALNQELKEQTEVLAKQISTNQESVDFFSTFPSPPRGIPSQSEYEAYQKILTKWISMSQGERSAWSTVLIGLREELEQERKRLLMGRDETLAAFESELKELSGKIAAAEEERKAILKEIAKAKAALEEPIDKIFYLNGLPNPLEATRTDAGGEFIFEVDQASSYIVVAEVERKVEGEMFDLAWMIRVDVEDRSRLLLSNHNVIGSDG